MPQLTNREAGPRRVGGLMVALALTVSACGAPASDGSSAATADPSGSAAAPASAVASADGSATGELVIASYGDVYEEATRLAFADPFAEETSTEITFVTSLVGGAAAAIQAQSEAGQIEWDILDGFSGIDAWQLYRDGLLAEIPDDLAARLEENLSPGAVTPFGFSYGNTSYVIACDAEAAADCPSTPEEFFDPEAFPGDRTLFAYDPLAALTLAAQALGSPSDDVFPIDIAAAFDKLNELRPHIRVFYETGDQSLQVMRTGEVSMGIYWDARAFQLLDEGVEAEISFDGAVYSPYYLSVVADSPNQQNALDYIEYVASNPEAAATWMTNMSYGIPIPAAFDHLDPEIAEQLGDNPDNLATSAAVDYEWYLDNRAEIDELWQAFVAGE